MTGDTAFQCVVGVMRAYLVLVHALDATGALSSLQLPPVLRAVAKDPGVGGEGAAMMLDKIAELIENPDPKAPERAATWLRGVIQGGKGEQPSTEESSRA